VQDATQGQGDQGNQTTLSHIQPYSPTPS